MPANASRNLFIGNLEVKSANQGFCPCSTRPLTLPDSGLPLQVAVTRDELGRAFSVFGMIEDVDIKRPNPRNSHRTPAQRENTRILGR